MSDVIYDNNGEVIGTKSGSVNTTADNIRSMPTIYESVNKLERTDSLELSAKGVDNLTYPLNGGNSHFIRFYINVNEESRLIKENKVGVIGDANYSEQNRPFQNQTSESAIKTGITAVGTIAGASLALESRRIQGAFRGKGTAIASGLSIAAAVAGPNISAITDFVSDGVDFLSGVAIEKFKLTQKIKRLAANITLYTPGNVKVSYDFKYEMPEDLIVTLAQQQNFDAIKSGLDAMGSALKDASPTAFGQALTGAGSQIGRIIASANQTGSMLSRTAVNHKRDIMFRHVGNRQFSFEYVFAPRSPEEAKEVYDIIFMFKYFAHPEILDGYGNFLYLYPAEFDIEYGQIFKNAESGGVEQMNPHINKISSCVLENIRVDYSPGGSFQSLERGEPVLTTLALNFKEIETLHRDRIARGY